MNFLECTPTANVNFPYKCHNTGYEIRYAVPYFLAQYMKISGNLIHNIIKYGKLV